MLSFSGDLVAEVGAVIRAQRIAKDLQKQQIASIKHCLRTLDIMHIYLGTVTKRQALHYSQLVFGPHINISDLM